MNCVTSKEWRTSHAQVKRDCVYLCTHTAKTSKSASSLISSLAKLHARLLISRALKSRTEVRARSAISVNSLDITRNCVLGDEREQPRHHKEMNNCNIRRCA